MRQRPTKEHFIKKECFGVTPAKCLGLLVFYRCD